jgi:ferredoxin-NADP reductase
MRALFDHAEKLSARTTTFWFHPEGVIRFEPGQYVELTVPHDHIDSRGDTRWMSFSSTPTEPLLGITTTFMPKSSSYKHALRALRPGDHVQFGSVLGDFVLPKSTHVPLIFIVGGIGIAPVRSMVKWLNSRLEHRDIRLLYSASTPQELIFNELLSTYPMRYTPIVTKPTPSWDGSTGRLTSHKVIDWLGNAIDDALIYLSGPQGLIEPLYNELLSAGLPRSQLVLDYFPGY